MKEFAVFQYKYPPLLERNRAKNCGLYTRICIYMYMQAVIYNRYYGGGVWKGGGESRWERFNGMSIWKSFESFSAELDRK